MTTSVLLPREQTGGAISASVHTVPADWDGPPAHHHAFDESFYVLDGELVFQLDEELATAGPGTFMFAPAGAVRTAANLGAAPARYLLLCTPAGPIPERTEVGPRLRERADLDRARPIPVASKRLNVHVRSEQSGGRLGLMENFMSARRSGPPLHHHDFDELFWVLEGELTFQLGSELVTRRAGEFAFAPRGAEHTFANRSEDQARFLLACTPGTFERNFARVAAREAGVEPPAWALQPLPEVTVIGPPIAVE
jgi:quercetin dioxygenase-like cupin family protein